MDAYSPLPGYDAWMSSRALQGAPEAVSANGIPNAIRYVFNIDPAHGPTEIGEPIIRVVSDANGNPCVRFREVVNPLGVTLDVLATERLDTWGESFLIDMEPFADGSRKVLDMGIGQSTTTTVTRPWMPSHGSQVSGD